jgi:hypothetical protein
MGFFDKLKKGIEGITKMAQMDDFLIAEIDRIISSEWRKISEKKPLSIGGISLEEEAEYNFTYETPAGVARVEMEHEFPYVEVEIVVGSRKIERRLKVSEFVEKAGNELILKNREELEKIVHEMINAAIM